MLVPNQPSQLYTYFKTITSRSDKENFNNLSLARPMRRIEAIFAITSSVVQALIPTHTQFLGGDASTFGVVLGAMGAGALLGAVIRPRLMGRSTLTNARTVSPTRLNVAAY